MTETVNHCGTCRLCCTVMRVEQFEPPIPDKEAGTPCQFLCREGCSIYEHRPEPCQVFACLWLTTQQEWDGKHAFSNSERPDRTGVVLVVNSKGTVVAHCKTPSAWKGDKIFKRLMALNQKAATNVTIEHGDGTCSILEKNGQLTPLIFIGLDEETNERKYVRGR